MLLMLKQCIACFLVLFGFVRPTNPHLAILRCSSLEIIQFWPHLEVFQVSIFFCASFHISPNVIFCRLEGTRGLLCILIDLWNVKRGMAS